MPPATVLVHGAFADSGSWEPVIELLPADHRVIAAANPLRSLTTDAGSVSHLVRRIDGPVVLVAHSYGGAVISNVDADAGVIVGLVFVDAFAPEPGENCFGLAGMFPGRMIGEDTVWPVPRSDGTTDFDIAPESVHEVFCADVAAPQAATLGDGHPRPQPQLRVGWGQSATRRLKFDRGREVRLSTNSRFRRTAARATCVQRITPTVGRAP